MPAKLMGDIIITHFAGLCHHPLVATNTDTDTVHMCIYCYSL